MIVFAGRDCRLLKYVVGKPDWFPEPPPPDEERLRKEPLLAAAPGVEEKVRREELLSSRGATQEIPRGVGEIEAWGRPLTIWSKLLDANALEAGPISNVSCASAMRAGKRTQLG